MYPFDRIARVRRITARVMGSLCPMFHFRYAFGLCSLAEFAVEDPTSAISSI